MNKNYSFAFPHRQMQLHAMLISCGKQVADSASYNWHGLKRGNTNFVLLQHTISGEGELVYEGKTYRLKTGDSMLVHIPHDHCYRLPSYSSHWEFMYACLNGKELIRICRELERRRGPVFNLGQGNAIKCFEETILQAANGTINSQYAASQAAYRLVMELTETVGLNNKEEYPETVSRAIDLCLRSPENPPGVEELANAANYSRWHFSRIFKQNTGMTPAAFVRDLQLRRATALLETGNLSVKEVAKLCGFNSTVSFCRAFKREYSYTPGRKQK